MAIAEVNGQRLYYEVHGEGEPLVCVHGLACNTLAWLPQVQPFAAAHRTVIFDNRDVGQSSRADAPYAVADMARDTLALADQLGLDSFHLLGISMGGAIAQELTLLSPERVRTLTLAVTWSASGAYSRRLARTWAARVAQVSREQHIDELMLLNHSEPFFDNPELVEFVRNAMLHDPHPQEPEAFSRQLGACAGLATRERLAGLTMPTHVIGGEHDLLVPVWKSKEIAALLPDARLTVLEGAPHGLSLERAEEFNAAVLDFIREAAPLPA